MSIYESKVKGHELLRRGKVRDIYSMGDKPQLMIVACDRISAFDCILPTPISGKGAILTQMSNFWFKKTEQIIPNHLVETNPQWVETDCCCGTCGDEMGARTVIVRKAESLPVEAIVRGYISGSGWKDYQKTGIVGGIQLKSGLRESDRLDEPIFTPSTKAEVGLHDENISYEKMVEILGAPLAGKVRDVSLRLYTFAADYALERGIIIADTKFEFGLIDGELILIDEILTPDSSRFWPVDSYAPGGQQPSYDKQYVRDYLETLDWKKEPPAPELPLEVVQKTADKYREAMRLLTEG